VLKVDVNRKWEGDHLSVVDHETSDADEEEEGERGIEFVKSLANKFIVHTLLKILQRYIVGINRNI
jgi:hypothetical protein